MQEVLLPLGPAVPATDANDASSVAVAPLAGGGYAIAHADSSGGVWVQRFDADGAEVGAEILVTSGAVVGLAHVSVAGLSNGSFVVTFDKAAGGGFADSYARVFGADGSPLGAEFAARPGNPNGANVLVLADGGFILTWNDFGTAIRAQRFDNSGNTVGSEITVATSGPMGGRGIGLAGGGFLVTWDSGVGTANQNFNGQLFDAAGQPVGAAFVIASNPSWSSAVAALPSGGFVATWSAQLGEVKAQVFNAAGQAVGGQSRSPKPGTPACRGPSSVLPTMLSRSAGGTTSGARPSPRTCSCSIRRAIRSAAISCTPRTSASATARSS